MKLLDKKALITGASRGIGRAIALELAREGVDIALNYLTHTQEAEELASELSEMGRKILTIMADVADAEQVDKMVEYIHSEFGSIDILINNAGIARDFPLIGMEKEEWDNVIAVNLTGIFNTCKAVGKYMVMQKSGKIINLSSVVAHYGNRGQANYVASKGGVEALTRALAIELAEKGITVNAVAPGIIQTKMTEEVIDRAQEQIMQHILLKRFGTLDEVAKLVSYLCSEDADYITGQVIHIDGGFGLCK